MAGAQTPLLDLDYAVDQSDWFAVKLLIDEIERDINERRRALLFRMAVWFSAVRVFRNVEARRMLGEDPTTRDRLYHRGILAFLKGSGEMLVVELRRHSEIDTRQIGVSHADLDACVEDLRLSEAEWYSDMTGARRNEILADVFGPETE
jgi:hypothetical protein